MATLSAHRAIVDEYIARHRGRIANTDGHRVLAEFGSVLDASWSDTRAPVGSRKASIGLAMFLTSCCSPRSSEAKAPQ
jgi:class 3 adenylate cyclase